MSLINNVRIKGREGERDGDRETERDRETEKEKERGREGNRKSIQTKAYSIKFFPAPTPFP